MEEATNGEKKTGDSSGKRSASSSFSPDDDQETKKSDGRRRPRKQPKGSGAKPKIKENVSDKSKPPKKGKGKGREDLQNQLRCVNLHCSSGTGLTTAPAGVLTFYNVKRQPTVHQQVCDECFKAADDHFKTLKDMMKNRVPLLSAEFPSIKDDVVDVDKVEELLEDTEVLPLNVTRMVEENLAQTIAKVADDYDANFQLNESLGILDDQYSKLEESAKFIDSEFSEMEEELEKMRRAIYKDFKKINIEVESVDLSDNDDTLEPLEPLSLIPPAEAVPAENPEVLAVHEITVNRTCPPVAPVNRPPLVAGDPVYIIRSSSFGAWLKGKVLNVIRPLQPERKGCYHVEFDSYRNKRKIVKGKFLAYAKQSKNSYPVATRVIAQFQNSDGSDVGYYVGIIAESPRSTNKFRYLVFFDDGYAQYATHDLIYPVCEVSKNVWMDVDEQSREFIKTYLEQFPERPMVRLQPGQLIRVEENGKWVAAKVLEIDASLAKVHFELSNRYEWIYRGATRLKPLYDEISKKKHRTVGASVLRKRNMPYVEYNRIQEVEDEEDRPTTRNVAKKTTTATQSSVAVYNLPPPKRGGKFEYKSKGCIRKANLANRIKSQPYFHHSCNNSCVNWTLYETSRRRGVAPLIFPLTMGFTRGVVKMAKSDRRIYYQAPCGRMLRNMRELRTYLLTTRCTMGVDMFDYDYWVKVEHEFHLEPSKCKVYVEDMSGGVENVSVSCVNEIDNIRAQKMMYVTKRIPQEGVILNIDPDFMVCCDCPDDCFNKNKCACWQMTIRSAAYGPDPVLDPTIGYNFRRLHEPVTTGIYECHSRCRCKKTCQNRVVQQPLSQKLQVFRTLRKGWGLRTLVDIPSGAFICIYVGRLHTEAAANEDGRKFGDEYLAELDFIEVVQEYKDGYEEDVVEDDEEYSPEVPLQNVCKGSITTRAQTNKNSTEEVQDDNCITLDDDEDDIQRESSRFTASISASESKKPCTRELFGEAEDAVYIMDAKSEGNIGRYLNHSCQPNVFVQNVFVDTHDLRFPWIAFFASSYIAAGSELTWDYNYPIGSVPNKVLYCYCGTPDCRGRLL